MGPVHTVWIICNCGWPVEVGAFCELPSISRYASGNRFRSRLRAVPPPRPGRSVRSSKPVSRSVLYCEKPVFEYSPSLGTSMPHSACIRTATATCRASSARSTSLKGCPSSLRWRMSTISRGRTRLPTWVVRIRLWLRFIVLTPSVAGAECRRLSLKPDIEGRQAELGATEHGGDLFRIVGDVGPHGVHVAPRALDRVVEEDGASAARLEQTIDGPHAPVDRLRCVPAIPGALGQRDRVAGRDQAHHLGEVRENPVARSVHLGGGVG